MWHPVGFELSVWSPHYYIPAFVFLISPVKQRFSHEQAMGDIQFRHKMAVGVGYVLLHDHFLVKQVIRSVTALMLATLSTEQQ